MNDQKHDEHNPQDIESVNSPSILSAFLLFSEKLASWRYLKWFVIALLPVMLLLRYPVEPFDYDIWWQMALGKYYLTNKTLIIDHSIFSWTPTDPGWIYNTCLGSIVLYLVYNMMGGLGLWVFQWLIFLGIFLSFYIVLRMLQQRLDITSLTIIAAIGITCSVSLRFYKPELFSPLLICWMGVIFICAKLTRKTYLFYIYPFMFVLWVNLHGGFILGCCLLVSFFMGEFLNRIFFPKESFTTKELFHLGLACFLCLLAIFINPYGVHYLLGIYKAAITETYTMNSKYILAYESLWPYFKDIKEVNASFFRVGQVTLLMAIMLCSLFGLFIYQLIKKRSCDFTFIILVVATYWGSMRAVRAIYMFPLLFFFAFYYLLHHLKLKSVSARATIISLLVFILLCINISYFSLRYGAENKWLGEGLESFAPVKEVQFLKKYRLDGPIFNDYMIGGYLLWNLYPDYKVFIDPRLGPYSKQVAPDYWEFIGKPAMKEDINNFTKKYPFKVAIIHYRELPLIFDFLQGGWRLLYFEKNATIMIHPSLIPHVPEEVREIDLGPARFEEEKNPVVLLNVFSLYVNLSLPASLVIYDIYKKNVSDFYKLKKEHLSIMEEDIRKKEIQIRAVNKKALPAQ
jgi:hypothetical protein